MANLTVIPPAAPKKRTVVGHVVARAKHAVRLVGSLAREKYKKKSRSPKWEKIERAYLAKFPTCAACGGSQHMQVHHKQPYGAFPALELEFSNLIGLCMAFDKECHLKIGHGDDWQYYSESVANDANILLANPQLRAEYEAKAKANRKKI